jgi:hypothetical protein
MIVRRARGAVLRLVRRRFVAVVTGLALTLPGVWLEWSGRYGIWWLDGASLVLGATGVALIWTGVSGLRPDWIEESKK